MSDTAIIEVSIPMHYLNEDEEEMEQCGICYQPMCHKECSRYGTHMSCCDQSICSYCISKTAMRCKCTQSCEQIISICPFCRDMCSIKSLVMYHAQKQLCSACKQVEKISPDTTDD